MGKIIIIVIVLIISIILLFLLSRYNMRKGIEESGGMQKIFHKFLESILRYPRAKIDKVSSDHINITWEHGSIINYMTIIVAFRDIIVCWKYGYAKKKWEFKKDMDPEVMASTIMKEIEKDSGQVIAQTPESLMDSVERNGVAGLAKELQILSDRMDVKNIISSNGNELIIHEADPEIISGFKQIIFILNNQDKFSDSEIMLAQITHKNIIDNEREMIRTQEAKDREVYVKAGVKKITHYFEGQFGYSIDYPC